MVSPVDTNKMSDERLHEKLFEGGDFDASTSQFQQSARLQIVESTGNVDATVVQFIGQLRHEDVEFLGAGGVDAMVEQEADDAVAEGLGTAAPHQVIAPLAQRGIKIEEVQSDDEEVVEQPEHFVLGKGDEVGLGQRPCRVGIAGGGSEKRFG